MTDFKEQITEAINAHTARLPRMAQQYRSDSEAGRLTVIVCRACGSPAVDHQDVATIRCTNCNNTTPLDCRQFAMVRAGSVESDLAEAFSVLTRLLPPGALEGGKPTA